MAGSDDRGGHRWHRRCHQRVQPESRAPAIPESFDPDRRGPICQPGARWDGRRPRNDSNSDPCFHLDRGHLLAVADDGYVLAATPSGQTNATLWKVSPDGQFTRILNQPNRDPSGLAVLGHMIVVTTMAAQYTSSEPALVLVSNDGGISFEDSAGWPDMAATDCLRDPVIREQTVIAGAGCIGSRGGDALFLAALS